MVNMKELKFLHLHVSSFGINYRVSKPDIAVTMETVSSSEISVNIYQTTRCFHHKGDPDYKTQQSTRRRENSELSKCISLFYMQHYYMLWAR
jgi:hypothetical protein